MNAQRYKLFTPHSLSFIPYPLSLPLFAFATDSTPDSVLWNHLSVAAHFAPSLKAKGRHL